LILAAVLIGGGIAVAVGLSRSREPVSIEDRIAEFATLDRPPSLEELEFAAPFFERIMIPVLRSLSEFIGRLTPAQQMEATQHNLELAGYPYGWGSAEFVGVRLLSTLLLGAGGLALAMLGDMALLQRIVIPVLGVAGGYYLPSLWVRSKISQRQREVVRALPDALDLLTICVEAGLGFDASMAKIAEKWDNALSRAFSRVIQELQLGKLRREALRDMSDGIGVSDVSSFVAAIIQADQLGVSIARVLRIQSDQMRVRRRQRAEEMARAATLKILPPVAFFIFPSIFIVLLGPAIIRLMTSDVALFSL
ncbi:MAG: type II secretion system F family protein, partial [Anaerolineales bacterium]